MNGAPAESNPGTVLTSTRISLPALALPGLLGLLSAACGMGPRGPLDGLDPGMTAIRVSNHVAAPGQLDRVTVTVDGQPLALSSVPPTGADPAVIARLHLAPGAHNIAVRGVALKRRGPDSEITVVGSQQPFHVGAAPAAITIDIRSGQADAASASPVAVSLAIQGGRMAPDFGIPPADDKEERCKGLLPIPRALCRAAVDLDEASRKNDIVAALCVRDKLAEMRRLAMIGETSHDSVVAETEAEVASLSHQVELCGADVPPPRPDGVTVIPPSRRQ